MSDIDPTERALRHFWDPRQLTFLSPEVVDRAGL